MQNKWTLKQLWDKACEYDRIPPKSSFVVFSDHNPWAKKYNFGMRAALASKNAADTFAAEKADGII